MKCHNLFCSKNFGRIDSFPYLLFFNTFQKKPAAAPAAPAKGVNKGNEKAVTAKPTGKKGKHTKTKLGIF